MKYILFFLLFITPVHAFGLQVGVDTAVVSGTTVFISGSFGGNTGNAFTGENAAPVTITIAYGENTRVANKRVVGTFTQASGVVQTTLTNLDPQKTYYYRIEGTSASSFVFSETKHFTTGGSVVVNDTPSAYSATTTALTRTGTQVVLAGYIVAPGAVQYYFEYDTGIIRTTAYRFGMGAVTETVLVGNENVRARIVLVTPNGLVYGTWKSLTPRRVITTVQPSQDENVEKEVREEEKEVIPSLAARASGSGFLPQTIGGWILSCILLFILIVVTRHYIFKKEA